MKEISFVKMHGIGNDYVYFTQMPCPEHKLPALSRRLSQRHTAIGGDGIILALPSDAADFRMRIFNADGSEAKMCGNGSRCVGKLVYDMGLTSKTEITLDTLSGIKHLSLHLGDDGKVESVTVDMGQCRVSEPVVLDTSAGPMEVTPVDMGNPHGVVFIDCDLADFDVHGIGRELETNPYWPDRANIEFAHIESPDRIKMRVWERGSGETMACGTGACATAAAARRHRHAASRVCLSLPGGDLSIEVLPDCRVMMTGPAATAFTGTVTLSPTEL